VYKNDDATTVVSPWADLRQRIDEQWSARASWKADVISTASVDIVTHATKRFDEMRNEATLEVRHDHDRWDAGLSYTGSIERDTRAQLVAGSGSLDLKGHNLTVALAYALGLDRIGQVHEPASLWRDRTSHRVDATVTQVFTPTTVGTAIYTFQYMSGFLASAYRMVPLMPRGDDRWTRDQANWVGERHPDGRGRHALTLLGRQALGRQLFARASWTGYLDTWAMRAHAATVGVTADVGHGLLVELHNRVYWQSRVSFYRDVYTVNRDYITRDRRLGGMLGDMGGLDLRWQRGAFEVLLRGELHWTGYQDFYRLGDEELARERGARALVTQAGVAVEF
jgi:hypothetical protein